jgi:hypothetical protein
MSDSEMDRITAGAAVDAGTGSIQVSLSAQQG